MTVDKNEAIAFMGDVVGATVEACRLPALWVPSVVFSLATDMAVVAADWPFRDGLKPPTEHTITIMVLVILAKGWFSLTLCRIALAGLRGQVTGVLNQWVPVQAALRIGVVSVVLLFVVAIGLACLVLPGLYLAARWSQVTMALLDDRARWFDAAEVSNALSVGYRGPIVVLLSLLAIVTLIVESLVNDHTVLAWTYRAVGSTVGAALAAALYYQLSRRAPWHPETQP